MTVNFFITLAPGPNKTTLSTSRPIQPINSRTVRTNIAFPASNSNTNNFSKSDYSEVDSECPEAFREMYYQANAFLEPVKPSP
jgi:hypothetical protein